MTRYNLRTLNNDDFNKGYLNLLNSLTNQCETKTSISQFNTYINNIPNNNFIIVIEDTSLNLIIGTITILIEYKLIHNCSTVCHIEDLIILNSYHSKGLGTMLLDKAKEIATQYNCYKIILNCNENISLFYKKNNFEKSAIQMRFNI